MGTWRRFVRIAHEQLTVAKMNRMLEYADKWGYKMIWTREPLEGESLNWKAFIRETSVEFHLMMKIGGRCKVYWCYLDGRDGEVGLVQGWRAYAIMAQYYKAPRMPWEICLKLKPDGTPNYDVMSASPLIWSNPKYDGKRTDAICYDINSAYGWAMEQPIPDTSKPASLNRIVKEGEIGFFADGESPTVGWGRKLRMVGPGDWAEFVYPTMPSPYVKFVDTWFRKKAKAKKKDQRMYAKNVVNEAIGYLQLVNPFIRATIVERCNKRIKALMDDDTVYCNTDCVCSARPRPEIEIGKEIGQFKIEHKGSVAVRGCNYQWGSEIPVYRGVPKAKFERWAQENGKAWDLIDDALPECAPGAWFDPVTRRIV